jgi:hypothetical protein
LIRFKEYENKIKNCFSEDDLSKLEREVCKLVDEHPKIDADRLFFLIADQKKNLTDHKCDPWKLRNQKNL